MIVGVVLTVIGAFFAIQAMQPSTNPFDFGHAGAPIVAFTLVPMGIIFTIVGYALTRAAGQTEQLLEQGTPGIATVVGVADTGVSINEQPMAQLTMNVQLAGRPPYTVVHRTVVPLVALGMITPGSTLRVAVDPANLEHLTIDWSGQTQGRMMAPPLGQAVGPAFMMAPTAQAPVPNTLSSMGGMPPLPNTLSVAPPSRMVGAPAGSPGMGIPNAGPAFAPVDLSAANPADLAEFYQALAQSGITVAPGTPVQVVSSTTTIDASHGDAYEAQVASMRALGLPARATIMSAQDLGIAVRGDRLVQFMLSITPDVGEPYTTQHVGIVPSSAIGRAVPGVTVPVLVDRTNHENVVIDWVAAG